MKRSFAALVAIAVLAACADRPRTTPVRAYAHFVDRVRAATGGMFAWPCDRGEIGRLPSHECYRMTAPQRMRGIWINEFEGSRFLPGATGLPADFPRSPRIWLDTQSQGIAGLARPQAGESHVWLIDFVGVQTEYPGGYGHMNGSDHVVVIQQLNEVRLLEWRAPPAS